MTSAWQMYAGWDPKDEEFKHFGEPWYVEGHGYAPVRVEVSEDPDGPYHGWMYSPGSGFAPLDYPTMIWKDWAIYRVQFTYGPEAEEQSGRGRTVRLSVRRLDP